jgi:hypothetical protein
MKKYWGEKWKISLFLVNVCHKDAKAQKKEKPFLT